MSPAAILTRQIMILRGYPRHCIRIDWGPMNPCAKIQYGGLTTRLTFQVPLKFQKLRYSRKKNLNAIRSDEQKGVKYKGGEKKLYRKKRVRNNTTCTVFMRSEQKHRRHSGSLPDSRQMEASINKDIWKKTLFSSRHARHGPGDPEVNNEWHSAAASTRMIQYRTHDKVILQGDNGSQWQPHTVTITRPFLLQRISGRAAFYSHNPQLPQSRWNCGIRLRLFHKTEWKGQQCLLT